VYGALIQRKLGECVPFRIILSNYKINYRFELFLPLHHLWLGYMSELLGLSPPPSSPGITPTPKDMPASSGMQAKLVKADFHGAIITGKGDFFCDFLVNPVSVQQSKNLSLLSLSGIVIHETENAFKVVTQKDKVKRASPPVHYFIPLKIIAINSPTKTRLHIHICGPPVLHSRAILNSRCYAIR
jgi:hypothetical protein